MSNINSVLRMAAASLPQEVVLKSRYNGKYLSYVEDEGNTNGFLRFGKEDFTSPLSKFQVEPAKSDSQLVHLRSSYNNKYLTAETETTRWITPKADEPEEDQSKWSCTLFEPVPVSGDDFRFKHVRTGNYIVLMKMGAGSAFDNCLFAWVQNPLSDLSDVVTVTDWRSLVILPRYIAFKGDNGNYLAGSNLQNGKNHLQFSSPQHEVFRNPDGTIRLKSTLFGKFWRADDPTSRNNWVLADSDDTSNDDNNTLFWPVKIDRDIIALRSLGNGKFCKRLITVGIANGLSATDPTISAFSHLQAVDLTRSREIYDIEFDLTHASKYNKQVVVMGTGEGSNTTSEAVPMDIKVKYAKPSSARWNINHSLNSGVKTKLVTKFPLIVDGNIELSAETTMLYEEGVIETPTDTFETVYNALVPPMTKATVYAKGSTTMFDVPFSYKQIDTYIDGTQHTHTRDDGTYSGMSSFNSFYEVKFENINPTI